MHFLLIALALFDLWVFIRIYSILLPDWFIHFLLLPGLTVGLYFLPQIWLLTLAAPGVVYLLSDLVQSRSVKSGEKRKKPSNMPPLP
jgi:hypothetical protein